MMGRKVVLALSWLGEHLSVVGHGARGFMFFAVICDHSSLSSCGYPVTLFTTSRGMQAQLLEVLGYGTGLALRVSVCQYRQKIT